MSTLDMTKLPNDPWELRSTIILQDIDQRIREGISFLKDEYDKASLFETCRLFVFSDLQDAPRSDLGSLRRVWLFPWSEIERELNEALNHSLLASYKSTFDNCRRALELAVVAAYFLQERIPEHEAAEWLASARDTPLFSRAVESLLRCDRFCSISRTTGWAKELREFYWRICDVVHVRGPEAGLREIQPSRMQYNELSVPMFAPGSMKRVADTFVETVRHVATIVAIENPVLLVGLDMEDKFGINPPMSGFFTEVQAARLRELLLPFLRSDLISLAGQDGEVQAVRQWIAGLPDITDEQLLEQFRQQDEWIESSQQLSPNGGEELG